MCGVRCETLRPRPFVVECGRPEFVDVDPVPDRLDLADRGVEHAARRIEWLVGFDVGLNIGGFDTDGMRDHGLAGCPDPDQTATLAARQVDDAAKCRRPSGIVERCIVDVRHQREQLFIQFHRRVHERMVGLVRPHR